MGNRDGEPIWAKPVGTSADAAGIVNVETKMPSTLNINAAAVMLLCLIFIFNWLIVFTSSNISGWVTGSCEGRDNQTISSTAGNTSNPRNLLRILQHAECCQRNIVIGPYYYLQPYYGTIPLISNFPALCTSTTFFGSWGNMWMLVVIESVIF